MKSDRSIMAGIKLTVLVDTEDLSLVVLVVLVLQEVTGPAVTSSLLSPPSTLSPGVSAASGLTSQPPTSEVTSQLLTSVSVSEVRVASLGLMVTGSLIVTLVTSTGSPDILSSLSVSRLRSSWCVGIPPWPALTLVLCPEEADFFLMDL